MPDRHQASCGRSFVGTFDGGDRQLAGCCAVGEEGAEREGSMKGGCIPLWDWQQLL